MDRSKLPSDTPLLNPESNWGMAVKSSRANGPWVSWGNRDIGLHSLFHFRWVSQSSRCPWCPLLVLVAPWVQIYSILPLNSMSLPGDTGLSPGRSPTCSRHWTMFRMWRSYAPGNFFYKLKYKLSNFFTRFPHFKYLNCISMTRYMWNASLGGRPRFCKNPPRLRQWFLVLRVSTSGHLFVKLQHLDLRS